MQLEISKEEQQQLLACLDVAIKNAQNSLQTASVLLPLASRISALEDDKTTESEVDQKSRRK